MFLRSRARSQRPVPRAFGVLAAFLLSSVAPVPAIAQPAAPQAGSPTSPLLGPFKLPTLIVTAQKEPSDPRAIPVSLTVVPAWTLADADVAVVSDAARYAPNTLFTEFTARKLSNARFRGIGSSPANPAVTTFFDGVPQLHANSSSVELLGVEQVEFVRGPQSALFGRNTLGGLVSVTTARPSLTEWNGRLSVPLASHDARDLQGSVSGPIVNGRLALGVSLQHGRREGFTRNTVTGHDLDRRGAFSGKGQLLWTPAGTWEARLIVSGERARDGDYALGDLAELRRHPFRVARDFEGHTDRDVFGTTVLARREGARLVFSTTTGIVRWKTEDATDLDYSPLPLVTRNNREQSVQVTQEVRLASSARAPARLSDRASLAWQTGVFVFTQHYDQDAANTFAPFVLSPFLGFPVTQRSPQSALDDAGVGVYGRGTITLGSRLDLTAGVRVDRERKQGDLRTSFDPAVAAGSAVQARRHFTALSPQLAAALRLRPDTIVYGSVARGFKAGGFNAASPAGEEAYGEEHTWNLEAGVKTMRAGDRVSVDASVFRTDWEAMQLNVPDPIVPGQFFIANVGGARTSGVELQLNGRILRGVDLFGAFGATRARFTAGSIASGVPVGGHRIPNTPDYTATVGSQLSGTVGRGTTAYARAEATFQGGFLYDESGRAGQERYSLADFRAGARRRHLFAELWVRNAFDTRYVPVAFPYAPFAASGFVGESGRPRTFGVRTGVSF